VWSKWGERRIEWKAVLELEAVTQQVTYTSRLITPPQRPSGKSMFWEKLREFVYIVIYCSYLEPQQI
jgi:hypothetical protein